MILNGDAKSINSNITSLLQIINKPIFDNIHCSIEVHFCMDNSEIILVNPLTLSEVSLTDLASPESIQSAFFLGKSAYELIQAALNKTIPEFNKQTPEEGKPIPEKRELENSDTTRSTTIIADNLQVINNNIEHPSKKKQKHQASVQINKVETRYEDIDPNLFIIENHTEDCQYKQRPAVFGVKMLSNNEFELFYRRSVYDKGLDTNFRRYLTEQPGTLVVYKYFHKIDSLKRSFQHVGLSLKHGRVNRLSSSQLAKILHDFDVLEFL